MSDVADGRVRVVTLTSLLIENRLIQKNDIFSIVTTHTIAIQLLEILISTYRAWPYCFTGLLSSPLKARDCTLINIHSTLYVKPAHYLVLIHPALVEQLVK